MITPPVCEALTALACDQTAATSLAAFVSFYQYVRGLKKRGYWSFSRELAVYVGKVTFCSLVMGAVLYGGGLALDLLTGGWLKFSLWAKLPLFGLLCFFGVVTFCIMTKITGVMDVAALAKSLLKRKERDV